MNFPSFKRTHDALGPALWVRPDRQQAARCRSTQMMMTNPCRNVSTPFNHLFKLTTTSAVEPAGRHRRANALKTTVDASGYAWIDEEELLAIQQDKSADCKYFFGQRAEDKSFKCRLCP
jgi:hypothetical protein